MRELATARPRFGYQRLHILLTRAGWRAGRIRVHRLYQLEGLQVRMRVPGKPTENGFIESCNGRLRDERLNVNVFATLDEARTVLTSPPPPAASQTPLQSSASRSFEMVAPGVSVDPRVRGGGAYEKARLRSSAPKKEPRHRAGVLGFRFVLAGESPLSWLCYAALRSTASRRLPANAMPAKPSRNRVSVPGSGTPLIGGTTAVVIVELSQ